jgi:hypothetical protein
MSKNDGLSPSEASRLFNANKKSSKTPRGREIERVRVHSLPELKKLINRLKPVAAEEVSPIVIDTKKVGIADESYDGNVVIPQSGGQSTVRQTLIDGFTMVKNHLEYHNASLASQSAVEDFGGFPPAVAPNPSEHMTWLDTFIDRNMGGRREGLHIVWNIPEGKFRYDPWSSKLEKVDVA